MRLINKISFLVIVLASLLGVSPAFAVDGVAKLELHISNDHSQRNSYFICVGEFGCYSIRASETHKSFPVETGNVKMLFATDVFTRRLYPQPMPASCNVQLNTDQTLAIYGALHVNGKNVTISNLHCRVA